MDFQDPLKFNSGTYDVITIGEVVVDFISREYKVENNARRMKDIQAFSRHFGGSAGNIAVNLMALGFFPGLISSLGQDFLGDYLMDFLLQKGISLKGISRTAEEYTSIVFVLKSRENPSFLALRGSDKNLRVTKAQEEIINRGKILHFTAWSLSHEPTRSSTLALIKKAEDKGLRISMDPNYREELWDNKEEGRRMIKEMLARVDFVKPSLEDARNLFLEDPLKSLSPSEYLDKFMDLGAKVVILTMGAEGLIAGNGKEEKKQPGRRNPVVDTTGAGDAFWAGMYASLLKGHSLETALEHGSQIAAFKLGYIGGIAPLPRFEQIIKKEGKEDANRYYESSREF